MAIKLPDPGNGIPEQKTGNDEWTNMKIVRDNFADQSNAASRLVGTSSGEVPLVENVKLASLKFTSANRSDANTALDSFSAGDIGGISNSSILSQSIHGSRYWLVETTTVGGTSLIQTAYETSTAQEGADVLIRRKYASQGWSDWRPLGESRLTYLQTTATAPNVVVDINGRLARASSSAKYKDILDKLELDDELYSKAMGVKPIIYRSKSEADPKDWHFMSFIAEELGELDPSLTQWRTHETDPETGEQVELEQKEAEGINLNAICAVLHATNIYQDKKLKELEQRLTALESSNEPIE